MRLAYSEQLPPQWEPTAQIFQALGDATRQRILLLFEPGELLSIKQIASAFVVSRTTVVHHLHVLEGAGLLTCRREGRDAFYQLRKEPLEEALRCVLDYATSRP